MVAEGQNWFNDPGLVLYLRGANLSWQPVWTSVSTSNYNISRNTNFTITIKAHNNGEVTWSRGGTYPTRLGTWNPTNRGSALSNPSWLNDIRPTDLIESSVSSGQDGTFSFTARTPSTPGPRHECFNIVDEGLEWSSDPGYCININVL